MHTCVQVHDAFATLLEVLACQQQHAAAMAAATAGAAALGHEGHAGHQGASAAAAKAAATSGAAASAEYHAFVESTSRQLLAVSYTRKGRCAGRVCAGKIYGCLVS